VEPAGGDSGVWCQAALGRSARLRRAAQWARRSAEWAARRWAVALAGRAAASGTSLARTARQIGIAPRTLAAWSEQWKTDGVEIRPRGRPPRPAPPAVRNRVVAALRREGFHVGVPARQGQFPDLSRRALAAVVGRAKALARRARRFSQARLVWHRPGAVWAVDFKVPPRPVDGRPAVLAGRDLASHQQLAWRPADQTAPSTAGRLAPNQARCRLWRESTGAKAVWRRLT
jgi:hypothetical protein